jgi:hypothetical protein
MTTHAADTAQKKGAPFRVRPYLLLQIADSRLVLAIR